MHRAVTFKIGGRKLHLVRVIAAFIILASAIMLLSDVFKMMQVAEIIQLANRGIPQVVTLDLRGITVTKVMEPYDANLQTGMVLVPIAGILFWSAVIIAGNVLYRAGDILLPIDEDIRELPAARRKKKR